MNLLLRSKSTFRLFVLFIFSTLIISCKNSSVSDDYTYPSVISGQVKNTEGKPLANARITLNTDPDYERVLSDANGFFRMQNVKALKHVIRVELYGYEIFESSVPSAYNGISTLNPVLSRKNYFVPSAKPISTGPVRILNRKLEVDFDGDGSYQNFLVKGAAYSITPIGNKPVTPALEDRSIQYLRKLNANTVRTYSGASPALLRKLAANGIYCIAGFWVNYDADLSDEAVRTQIKEAFALFVSELKDNPGLLMYTIGNEQNYANGDNEYWYTLVQELAILAFNIEGDRYHPVSINNGNIFNIGNASKSADDASLSYVDIWATNTYEYDLSSVILNFKTKSAKPILFTEFGIDALDNRSRSEYEIEQAKHDSLNWVQIVSNPEYCLGGTVFEYTDEWWKAGDPSVHDYGGYATGAHPDGYSNEEWWGLIRVLPDANSDGLDEWQPREAYYMFMRNWK